jgi:predicted CoA-binding protein
VGGASVTFANPEDRELEALLNDARMVAVVGLSSKPLRPSHEVARYLQAKGYRIIPVNPNETEVLGEPAFGSLPEIPADVRVDVVDVFRRPEETPEVARQAVAIGARALWLQEGIENEEAAIIATAGGLDVVMGICMKHVRQRLEASDATVGVLRGAAARAQSRRDPRHVR